MAEAEIIRGGFVPYIQGVPSLVLLANQLTFTYEKADGI